MSGFISRSIAPALLAVTALSCGQILDADAYAVGTGDDGAHDGGAAVAMTGLPLLPAQPDAARLSACEQCARDQCADERAACLESERCTALLACHGWCSDPNCVHRCRDIWPESLVFEDYFACVFGSFTAGPAAAKCWDACSQGGNWDCVGAYRWDARDPEVELVIRAIRPDAVAPGPLRALQNVELAMCEELATGDLVGDRSCSGWTSVDAYGNARLTAGRRRSAIALRGGNQERHRIYTRPLQRSGAVDLYVFPSYVIAFLAEFLAQEPTLPDLDPTRGHVVFRQNDCHGRGVGGVRVELSNADSETVRYYWAGYGAPDVQIEAGGDGGFVNVPVGTQVKVTSTLDASDEPLSRRRVLVAPGWLTDVSLYPDSE